MEMAEPVPLDEIFQSRSFIMKKSICIIAFSHIARDARVLRQIRYLSRDYDLVVLGYGPPHPAYQDSPAIRWVQLDQQKSPEMPSLVTALKNRDFRNIHFRARAVRKLNQALNLILSWMGILIPRMKEAWYWRQFQYRNAWQHAVTIKCHAYHANDLDTLPLAADAARRNRAKLILDLHEYAPLEYEESPRWWIKKRFITHLLRKYAPRADASLTVAAPIAQRYADEFGFTPEVIRNVPEQVSVPDHAVDRDSIRLLHHGGASWLRKPELMIRTMALCEKRYSLHFMFLQNEYIRD